MGCGCNRKPSTNKSKAVGLIPDKPYIQHIQKGKTCPKCSWLMRTVNKYNLSTKRTDTTLLCSNKACKFSKSK